MKKTIVFIAAQLCILASIFFNSCALIELEEEQVTAVDMHLDRDSIYVEVGDQFTITPVFDPDTITLSDIYWEISAPEVVNFYYTHFAAESEGWATIRAISVSQQQEDSCHVCVLPRFDDVNLTFPYETVIYAKVSVKGQEFNPETMRVLAYVGNDLGGFGEMKEQHGVKYMVIRAGSEMFDEENVIPETVTLYLYNKKEHSLTLFKSYIEFDGESHGNPINPIELTIK